MANQTNKPERIDPIFSKTMKDLMKIRLNKKLAKMKPVDLGMPEATRLLMKTEGFKISCKELMNKKLKK